MPHYRIEALEKFIVRTAYEVEAASPEQAEQLCRDGKVGYDEHSIEEGDEEWLETVSIEPLETLGDLAPEGEPCREKGVSHHIAADGIVDHDANQDHVPYQRSDDDGTAAPAVSVVNPNQPMFLRVPVKCRDVVLNALSQAGFSAEAAAVAAFTRAYVDPASNADRVRGIERARQAKQEEGSIEFDEDAAISRADDNGQYVMAWVWIEDADDDFEFAVKVEDAHTLRTLAAGAAPPPTDSSSAAPPIRPQHSQDVLSPRERADADAEAIEMFRQQARLGQRLWLETTYCGTWCGTYRLEQHMPRFRIPVEEVRRMRREFIVEADDEETARERAEAGETEWESDEGHYVVVERYVTEEGVALISEQTYEVEQYVLCALKYRVTAESEAEAIWRILDEQVGPIEESLEEVGEMPQPMDSRLTNAPSSAGNWRPSISMPPMSFRQSVRSGWS